MLGAENVTGAVMGDELLVVLSSLVMFELNSTAIGSKESEDTIARNCGGIPNKPPRPVFCE